MGAKLDADPLTKWIYSELWDLGFGLAYNGRFRHSNGQQSISFSVSRGPCCPALWWFGLVDDVFSVSEFGEDTIYKINAGDPDFDPEGVVVLFLFLREMDNG